MSDNQTPAPAQKSSIIEKGAKWAAVGLGAAALAAVVPQDKLPNFWESLKAFLAARWEDVRTGATKFRPIAFAWGAKLWFWTKAWVIFSLGLVIAGIEVKGRFDSNFGHVLVAVGTLSFVGLGLILYALSEGIATILFFKIKIAGGIFKKAADFVGIELPKPTPAEIAERKLLIEKYHDKVKLVLAGTVVLCFSLVFTMFFPEYSTLGWTLCFWPLVGVALCAAIYLDLKMGKAVQVVFYVTVTMIALMFVVFLIDRLTGGAIGFAPFREWLRNVNGSEVLAIILVLVPLTLLLVGAFAKDKDRKSAFMASAKYVGIGCALLGAFLLYKGTISWKQLSGKEPPKAVSEAITKIEETSIDGRKTGASQEAKPTGSTHVSQGTASNGGLYMSPPSGDPMPHEEVLSSASKPTKAATQRRASKPLPKEEVKTYSNLTQGVDDLEALGY